MVGGRFKVRATRFPSGERFALLYDNRDGLPLAWTTRFSAVFRRTKEGSVSTMEHELRAIALALEWAEEAGIDLEQRIGGATFLLPEEVLLLRDALRHNRKSSRCKLASPAVHYSRCVYVRDYIKWRGQNVVQRILNDDPKFFPARTRLEEFVKSMTSMLPKARPMSREGVGGELEQRLRAIIQPDSADNPFQAAHRHRNYALLLCYLDLGIRLSEALVIKTSDLRLSGPRPTLTIHRRADDVADTRQRQPLVKTAWRTLPLDDGLRDALNEWLLKHRPDQSRYPGSKRNPYVFVSRQGRPLAARSVHELFVRVGKRLDHEGTTLSAHLLRHTWNDNYSALMDRLGTSDEQEQRTRTYLMGWKKGSGQAHTYTRRRTREEASSHSLALQRKSHEGTNR